MACFSCFAQVEISSGTFIPMEVAETINSKFVSTGQPVKLKIRFDVKINDTLNIPAGTSVDGKIVKAQKAKGVGEGGFLEISAQYLSFNGKTIPISGSPLIVEGKDKKGAAIGLTIAGFFFICPFNFFFLAIKGQEAIITPGTLLDGVVVTNIKLE